MQIAKGYRLGRLRSGNSVLDHHIVKGFSELVGNRAAIFAQSGFGKSNLMRVLFWHMMSDVNYGKLIFDQKGEYALDTQNEKGELVPGLYRHPAAKDNLVMFTTRKSLLESEAANKGLVTIKHIGFRLQDIYITNLLLIYPHFTGAQKELLYFYDEDPDFFDKLLWRKEDNKWDEENWQDNFKEWLSTSKKSGYTPLRSVRKKLVGVQKRRFFGKSVLSEILEYLKVGLTVIVDLSGIGELDQEFVASIICRRLFNYNLDNMN